MGDSSHPPTANGEITIASPLRRFVLDGPAFCAARQLVVDGCIAPSGYTEPALHHWRAVAKGRGATQ